MNRFVACAAILCNVVLLGGQSPDLTTGDPYREFTSFDSRLKSIVQTARGARLAAEELRRSPGAPETIRRLLVAEKSEDAIAALRLAVAGPLEQAIAALQIVSENFWKLQLDATRGYPATVAEVIQPLRSKLGSLPREDAASLARVLVSIDSWLGPNRNADWADRLKAFAQEYAGTRAGLLAEIDVLNTGRDLLARINALDAFWKAHPASEAGAKALYLKGFELHVNVPITGVERRGSDPLPRFLQVVAIVDELESGRYPDGEWIKKAPQLISGFFVSQSPKPAYADGSIDRMLAEYQRFVVAHFGPIGGEDTGDSSLGYVVTSKMGDLFELKGDRVGGVERTIAALEALPDNKRAAELFHAQFLVTQATTGPEGNRAAMRSRAESALQALADAKDGYHSRKAAAVLAGLHMFHRDYARALPAYRGYVSAYPESPFAWVAELRAGQCLTGLGQTQQSADVYERIATRPSAEPIAVAISSTLAGQAHDALGRFDRSLAAYRRASNAWSADFLNDATPTPSQARLPAPATGNSETRLAVTLENISDRIASLERHAVEPAGSLVERTMWQIDHREFAAARNTARQALGQSRNPGIQAEARALGHRAELELAMEMAAIEGGKPDEGAALRAFNAISDTRFDSNIGLAGIASATLLFKDSKAEPARARMTSTLDAWLAGQRPLRTRPPASPIEADIAEIRAIIFQPTGGFRLLAEKHWNAFTFPSAVSYVVVNPDVRVKVGSGRFSRLTVYQELPGLERALFLSTDDLAVASRLIITLGGTARRQPTGVMETPNQPAGPAVNVMAFWNGFFPTRQGHWGGWVLETYPIIDRIEFLDEARTRASVFVTVGYSGATVVMEKRNGVWQAISLMNQWIT